MSPHYRTWLRGWCYARTAKGTPVGTDYAAHDYDVLYDTIQCTRQLGTKYRYAPTRNKVLCDTVQTNNTKELRKNRAYFGPNTVYSCSKIQRTGWRTSRVKRSSVMTPDSDNALVVQHWLNLISHVKSSRTTKQKLFLTTQFCFYFLYTKQKSFLNLRSWLIHPTQTSK